VSNPALHTVSTEREPVTVLDTGRRAYLTEGEIEQIIRATRSHRDALMVLIGYRHGLRVSELVGIQWRQLDLDTGHFRVRRAKHGEDAIHPLGGREIRGLRKIRREQPVEFRFVFDNGRGETMTRNGFYKLLARAGAAAGIPNISPHTLRHACGFKLVNQGMDTLSLAAYLGHRNVQNTARYTKMSVERFEGLWRD